MKHLPIGLFMLVCGAFLLGLTTSTIGNPGLVGALLPILAGLLMLIGYFVCRPAMRQAKAELALSKRTRKVVKV